MSKTTDIRHLYVIRYTDKNGTVRKVTVQATSEQQAVSTARLDRTGTNFYCVGCLQ